MNISNTLSEGISILKENKIKNPQLDVEILLSKLIRKDKKYLILNPKEVLNPEKIDIFKNLIDRRKKGEPVAYLINEKAFWKNEFYVDKDVLIPRPDTELLIEKILQIYSKKPQLQILDIGTGSGCILLSLLKERRKDYGTGIDISKKV